MADDEQRLLISLEARLDKFEKSFTRAQSVTNSGFGKIERRAKESADKIDRTMADALKNVGKGFLTGIAGGLAIGGLDQVIGRLAGIAKGVASIGDEAKRAGLSSKAFQELAYVARQNRIEVDALVDGMKELALRADEYIVTGQGSAAASFKRLGYTADQLKEKLRDPSALFSEIIGKVQQLDRAGQIRVFDELFGGTGGEKFVQLISQGEAGIRAQIQAANDLGLVMNDDLIKAADELDRRFEQITDTINTNLKGAVVGIVDEISHLVDGFRDLENRSTSALREQLGFELKNLADIQKSDGTPSFFDPLADKRKADLIAEAQGRIKAVQNELARRSFPELRKALTDQRSELDKTKPAIDGVNTSLGNVNGAAGSATTGISTFADAIRSLKGEIPELAEQLADLDAKTRIDATYRQALSKARTIGETIEATKLRDQALSAVASKDIRAAADKGILDLIAAAEGTDKGRSYNETLAYGKFTGGPRNLVLMTLDEVDALQSRMLADPANTFNSSAVGRYQFTKTTLKDLRASLGLKGDEIFGPELQDRLAEELLRRAGNNPDALRGRWEGLRRVDDNTIRRAYDSTSVSIPAIDPGKAENIAAAREQAASYAQIIAESKRYTDAQNQEQQALGMTASAAAKLRYEQQMLAEAQARGIALTPQQREEISALAAGMAQADAATQKLVDGQRGAAEASRFFGEQLTGALGDILTGSASAEQALKRIVDALIQATLQAALLGEGPLAGLLTPSGGKSGGNGGGGGGGGLGGILGGFLGALFGFANGGFTGPGAKDQPAGIVHAGEYVMSADAVRRIGVGNLEVLHRSALKGYSTGGLVSPAPTPRLASPATARGGNATQAISINAPITVNTNGGGTPAQNADLAKQMGKQLEATMRGVVSDELRKQMRPGNLANSRGR